MVALKAGILKSEETGKPYAVMLASEFRNQVGGLQTYHDDDNKLVTTVANMEAFREIAHDLRVLARADATDKLTLIIGL
jgi:hypothetical protein